MNKQYNPEHHDNPEWTEADVKRAKRLSDLPPSLQSKLRGRPKADSTKERITIRLSPEVLKQFRASGQGWQTRLDSALKEWLKTHQA